MARRQRPPADGEASAGAVRIGELGLLVEDRQHHLAGSGRQPEDAFGDADAGEVVELAEIGQRAERHDLEFVGITPGRLRGFTQYRQRLAESGAADRDPALAVLDDVREQFGSGAAAQQDRQRPLHGLRP